MPTLSETDSDDNVNEGIWQQVPGTTNKRKLINSPNIQHNKRINLSDEPSTSTQNRFDVLKEKEGDKEPEGNAEKEDSSEKPPPIYIPYVSNISMMIKSISSEIPCSDFNYKSMKDNQIRLMIKNSDSFRKTVKYLELKNISFHTYQLKQERAYRVVIKGIHHSTLLTDIKAELILLGYQVRDVVNVKSRITKQPLSMFFVDLEPHPDNKNIFNIKYIGNAIVSIEAPKKTDDLVQCYRCQQFGHTKSYCRKPFRCVKCGSDHSTASCTKDINTPPKCLHCQQTHTANYKGCNTYQQLLHQKRASNPRNQYQSRNEQIPVNSREFPHLNENSNANGNNNNPGDDYISYSQAVRGNGNNTESRLLERLERMMDKMFDMMSQILMKLCK